MHRDSEASVTYLQSVVSTTENKAYFPYSFRIHIRKYVRDVVVMDSCEVNNATARSNLN